MFFVLLAVVGWIFVITSGINMISNPDESTLFWISLGLTALFMNLAKKFRDKEENDSKDENDKNQKDGN